MLTRLADLAARRPRLLLAGAVAFTAAGLVVGSTVTSRLASGGFDDPTMQSVQASDLLQRATGQNPGETLLAIVSVPEGARTPEARARITALGLKAAAALGPAAAAGVSVGDPAADPRLVSRDGKKVLLVARGVSERAAGRIERALRDERDVLLGGSPIVARQVDSIVARDLRRAELIAFPLVFLLSLWVFRGLVAALLPPLVGAVAIAGAFLGLRLAAEATTLSVYALNLVVGMGLGLAIDYSLFVVSRYREELARAEAHRGPGGGHPGPEPLRRTLATAGRTVLFSGLTVAAALASLLVFRQKFLFSMGLGGMLVALVAMGAALVALPALLSLLGHRVNALSPAFLRRSVAVAARPAEQGFWFRLARLVMRRPLPIAVAAAALLLTLGSPFLGIRFTTVDARVLPASSSGYQVNELLRSDFARSLNPPVYAAIQTRPGDGGAATRVGEWAARVHALPDVADVSPPQRSRDGTFRVDVGTVGFGNDPAAERLVQAIRALPAADPVLVGGRAAFLVDQKRSLGERLPWAAAIVVVTTLLVLFAMTGSLLLPIKAVVLNLLTISAVFGVLVWIFQEGHLQGLLGFRAPGAIDTTQPLMIAAIGFGLSTDYGVFLLSRIKEARDAGLDDAHAVAAGLERTGRIVTAAALLFVVAIGAFATSRIVQIKEIGIGTALAVVLDATIVRALLVPSLMQLLGRWNWWAPAPLARLHARLGGRSG